MIPLLQPIIKTTTTIVRATRNAITPFSEQPPANTEKENDDETANLKAFDLFSCFTADIIREKVVFTR